jgi:hypothetical protein
VAEHGNVVLNDLLSIIIFFYILCICVPQSLAISHSLDSLYLFGSKAQEKTNNQLFFSTFIFSKRKEQINLRARCGIDYAYQELQV